MTGRICGACGGAFPNAKCGHLRNAQDSRLPVPCYPETDYYESHEALVDLLHLWSEHEALNGGGPGWQERFRVALGVAYELTRREP